MNTTSSHQLSKGDKELRDASSEMAFGRRTKLLAGIAAASFLIPALIYAAVFWLVRNYPLGDPQGWADFSTFISGIATPFIAFCSVMLFTYSISIQQREMRETRNELATSRKVNEQSLQKQQDLHREQLLVSHIERRVAAIDRAVADVKSVLVSVEESKHPSIYSRLPSQYRPPDDIADLVNEINDAFEVNQAMGELKHLLEQYAYCAKLVSRFMESEGSSQMYVYEKIMNDMECFYNEMNNLVTITFADDTWLTSCHYAIEQCVDRWNDLDSKD